MQAILTRQVKLPDKAFLHRLADSKENSRQVRGNETSANSRLPWLTHPDRIDNDVEMLKVHRKKVEVVHIHCPLRSNAARASDEGVITAIDTIISIGSVDSWDTTVDKP